MTEYELRLIEQDYTESKIQHTCVQWFRLTFPKVGKLLFSVPNGGYRPGRGGAMMSYEGQVRGVSDLILLFPSKGKASLCIEMKRPKKKGRSEGVQKEWQKSWQQLVESYGSVYVVCRGLIEFIEAVCAYLHIENHQYKREALNKYPLYVR